MNVTNFSHEQQNAYLLDIVLLTKCIDVMISSINVYILLVMLHVLKMFLISRRNKRQETVTRSSIEVEYRATTDTVMELKWLHGPCMI